MTTVTTAMIIDIRTTIATDTPTITDAEFELLFSAEEKKNDYRQYRIWPVTISVLNRLCVMESIL